MSETMTVNTDRFQLLETSVHDIDKRMIPIEHAIPSIDTTLKLIAQTLQQQQINDAVQKERNDRQDATNRRLGAKLSAVEDKVSENEKKIIRITVTIGLVTALAANAIPVLSWLSSVIK
tara:strand:- start:6 stop:362 length:357 start_codon:yes stop_codon:yes gene_type:complete